MKSSAAFPFVFLLFASSLFQTCTCFANENNVARPLQTDFAKDAQLTEDELNQIVLLARQSGISNVAKVRTFHYLPVGGRGISAESKRRIEGRNTSYETLWVHRSGWGGAVPEPGAKRVGSFWAIGSKHSTLTRTYEINGDTNQITIGAGIEIKFADKVISLLASKKVRFENDWPHGLFAELQNSCPYEIRKDHNGKAYELWYSRPALRSVTFKLGKNEVIVLSVAVISI
jgi:hypothetical protein